MRLIQLRRYFLFTKEFEFCIFLSLYSPLASVGDCAPQVNDEVIGESKALQIWVVNCLSKVHRVCLTRAQVVNLNGQLVVVDAKKWVQQDVDCIDAWLSDFVMLKTQKEAFLMALISHCFSETVLHLQSLHFHSPWIEVFLCRCRSLFCSSLCCHREGLSFGNRSSSAQRGASWRLFLLKNGREKCD